MITVFIKKLYMYAAETIQEDLQSKRKRRVSTAYYGMMKNVPLVQIKLDVKQYCTYTKLFYLLDKIWILAF